ncbi:type II toxin-antitoxin system HicB family antitoxin [Patescibacteria group bacterium]|nr:type II toxin-antitoxin system HicB family antitoxin [Patescibacteria group bacterium]
MKHIIQFQVYKGENAYVGEGINLPIVTQGATLDEVVNNLKEALALHLEGENPADLGFAPQPSALVNFELDSDYAKA